MNNLKFKVSLIYVLCLLWISTNATVKYNIDSVLSTLDSVLNDRLLYESKKNKRITNYKKSLNGADNDYKRYDICNQLYSEYMSYNLDSAYYYAKKQLEYAHKINLPDYILYATMNEVDGLKGHAKIEDADRILNSISLSENDIKKKTIYFHLRHSITLLKYNSAIDEGERKAIHTTLLQLRDSISKYNDKNSIGWIINKAEIFKAHGNYNQALLLLTNYITTHRNEAYSNATFLCTLADTYKLLNNREAQKYFLTLATIKDKQDCKKTYTSLQRLAMLLNQDGDTHRAYNYITYALNDIISSGAKNRLNQVAEIMPIITSAHNRQEVDDENRRKIFTGVVIFLVVALGVALIILFYRNKKLRNIQCIIDGNNEKLLELNNHLETLNLKLSESNKIKEVYIAQLFNICSINIEDISKFKMSVCRKLKAGQINDVEIMLRENTMKKDLKKFFINFDEVFLKLFPNFVNDFNKLLKTDCQIQLKEGEMLTQELRIYALVRLGINDSTKIAKFLHLSSQTVYNYRQKIRSKALPGEETFRERVQKL